jgi:hypothetical protein
MNPRKRVQPREVAEGQIASIFIICQSVRLLVSPVL